jgi:tol-pal system protein YbgF
LSGCALKGDVRRVESQLIEFREETARADSARAVTLGRLLDRLETLNREISDSLAGQQRSLLSLRAEFRTEVTEVQRQLVAIQELTGQSQARLAALRRQLESRPPVEPSPGDTVAGESPGPAPGEPGPEELFSLGRTQQSQGSPETARTAYRHLLQLYPDHERAADALFYVGDTFGDELPDSAQAAWEQVVQSYPSSPRAPSALFRLGLMFERLGDEAAARLQFQRVVSGYPNSEEARLARQRLGNP